MSFEESKNRSFKIVGGHDIQFCPYCGEPLSEAVDHEIFEDNRNNIHVITSNCPEKTERCEQEHFFCPRCGEDISTENLAQKSKHKIELGKDGATITCPFEKAQFNVTLSIITDDV
jgi:hypothetical protein